jgi:hypothetical protein
MKGRILAVLEGENALDSRLMGAPCSVAGLCCANP